MNDNHPITAKDLEIVDDFTFIGVILWSSLWTLFLISIVVSKGG